MLDSVLRASLLWCRVAGHARALQSLVNGFEIGETGEPSIRCLSSCTSNSKIKGERTLRYEIVQSLSSMLLRDTS